MERGDGYRQAGPDYGARSARDDSTARETGRADRRRATLLALLAFLVFNANFRLIGAGDSYPARIIPLALLKHGTLFLDAMLPAARGGLPEKRAYWIQPARDGRKASLYPVVTPILVTPLYVPMKVWIDARGWETERVIRLSELMEKLSASTVASITCGLMYLLLRRRASQGDAMLLAAAFAFGTNTWVTSSQALWQHGASQLFVVGALLCLTRERAPFHVVALAGLLTGLLVANRPPTVAIAAVLACYAIVRWRTRALLFVGMAALPLASSMFYNAAVFGMSMGGYQRIGVLRKVPDLERAAAISAELLASPTRGLLVFSPFLLFGIAFAPRMFRERGDRALNALLLAGFAGLLAIHALVGFRPGFCFGPRFLVDGLPLLIWLLVPVVGSLGIYGRRLFVGACVVAVLVQAAGAYCYMGRSDLKIYAPNAQKAPFDRAWVVRNSPLVEDLRFGPARLVFLERIEGSIRRWIGRHGGAREAAR